MRALFAAAVMNGYPGRGLAFINASLWPPDCPATDRRQKMPAYPPLGTLCEHPRTAFKFFMRLIKPPPDCPRRWRTLRERTVLSLRMQASGGQRTGGCNGLEALPGRDLRILDSFVPARVAASRCMAVRLPGELTDSE